jgi:uncharacterized membrane protein (UPF0127 family)
MLINKSNEKVISREEEIAGTLWKRMRGLMFRKRIDKPLIFILPRKTRFEASIHMFFVFFPIDLVYLDENWKVVDLREKIAPFTLNVTPIAPAKYFIELGAGSIKKFKIRIGNRILWKGGSGVLVAQYRQKYRTTRTGRTSN